MVIYCRDGVWYNSMETRLIHLAFYIEVVHFEISNVSSADCAPLKSFRFIHQQPHLNIYIEKVDEQRAKKHLLFWFFFFIASGVYPYKNVHTVV